MREEVVFKGYRDGLQLVWNESADFSSILEQLKDKLEAATDFFTKGTKIKVVPKGQELTEEQCVQLSQLLAKYGLKFTCEKEENQVSQPAQETMAPLIVTRTIRGGQKIVYEGTIVIHGDVNPGAEIIAGGDIIITGTCRGVVHAGAYGESEATITANRLLASQIRIAGLIARAPDNMDDDPRQKERAKIESSHIIIEPAE